MQNVLILHAHDAGRYISPYGHKLPTPHLQAFSERATTFRNAHCAAPTCSPSRAALLTGMNAHQAGMLGLVHRGFGSVSPENHLAPWLKRQGYDTALFGIQHEFEHEKHEQFYDERHCQGPEDNGIHWDIQTSNALADWLQEDREQPFFAWMGLIYPHRDFPASLPDWPAEKMAVPPIYPDNETIREDMARYAAAVSTADIAFGRVLDGLAKSPHADNTIVIITTDHGIAFPYMKCNLTQHGTGVFLMIDYPGNENRGEHRDALVSHLDLFPTLCDLLDLDAPSWLEGNSLRPAIRDNRVRVRNEAFAEVSFHAAYEPMRSIRTDTHLLIKRFGERLKKTLPNIDAGLSKSWLIEESGLVANEHPRVALFETTSDPQEQFNRADDPSFAAVRAHLEESLEDWMRETNDPLLVGEVAAPSGSKLNRAGDRDPDHKTMVTTP